MNKLGLHISADLTDSDFAQIRDLESICNQSEKINVKLNWGLMKMREPDKPSDFCFYEQGQLVGYMPLDGFGDQFEITAIVHPAYRRQGIFKQLFAAAHQEAMRRNAARLLLVNYRNSQSGNATVRALGLPYYNSEYHMETSAAELTSLPASQIQLVEVTAENVRDLSSSLGSSFGAGEWNSEAALLADQQRKDGKYYLAELAGTQIGQIGMVDEGNQAVYIRAVGIAPEWRGHGYGRQLLSALVQKLRDEGYQRYALDVETQNTNALSLYQSCGFHETNVYDYYTVPLALVHG
ncbi:MAG: GNAT family N-acetyltransferase [Caldilineaceae bacterium]